MCCDCFSPVQWHQPADGIWSRNHHRHSRPERLVHLVLHLSYEHSEEWCGLKWDRSRQESRTDRIEIWELITTNRIKNMCIFSANEVADDHRLLSARAGLPCLHPLWARSFPSNSRSSSCAFPNSLLRSHVSSQRTLYSCPFLVSLVPRILMISHSCSSSPSFKSAVSAVRLECKLSIAPVAVIGSVAVRSVEPHIHGEVAWSAIGLATSSLSEDCPETSDGTEADEAFGNRREYERILSVLHLAEEASSFWVSPFWFWFWTTIEVPVEY